MGPDICNVKTQDIPAQYPQCFQGFGKLKGYQPKIHADPEVKPVAQSVRIPFRLRSKLENRLQELIEKDIRYLKRSKGQPHE